MRPAGPGAAAAPRRAPRVAARVTFITFTRHLQVIGGLLVNYIATRRMRVWAPDPPGDRAL